MFVSMKDAAYLLRLAVGVYTVVLSNYFVCIVTSFILYTRKEKGTKMEFSTTKRILNMITAGSIIPLVNDEVTKND